jgi:hypothetical protein
MRALAPRFEIRLLLSLLLIGGTLCGCTERPFLSAGDANSAEVGYSRDLAAATEVAKEHCARYEKVPRYLDSSENIAYFACEHR